jgi:PAS domain S-box-containing protein
MKEEDKSNEYLANQSFDSLVNLFSDAVYIINCNTGKICFANTAACQNLGYSLDILKAKSIWDIDNNIGNLGAFSKIVAFVLEKGNLLQKGTYKAKDNNSIPVEINYSADKSKKKLLAIVRIQEQTSDKYIIDSNDILSQHVQELAKVGSCERNLITGELRWSKGVYDILGLDPQSYKITQDEFLELIHPEDLESYKKNLKKGLLEGNIDSIKFRAIHTDDTYHWYETKSFSLNNELGQAVYLKGTIQDITEQMQIKLALEQSKRRYKSIIQNATSCIHELDKEGKFLSMNRAGLNLFGLENELDILGLRYENCACETDKEWIKTLMKKAFAQGVTSEFEFLGADNKTYFSSNFIPLIKDGKVEKIMGISNDITIRKKAEMAIRESEERWSSLIEHMPNIVIIVDKNIEITYINHIPKRFNLDTFWGESVLNIVFEESREALGTAINKVFKTGTTSFCAIESYNNNNNRTTYDSYISPILLNGEIVAVGITSFDVSDRKEVEKLNKANSQLVEAEIILKKTLLEKEVLLKEIHHRVKNNMQVITSLLSLQSSFIEDPKIKAAFTYSQYRINAMGMVHEMLYQSDDISSINYENYLERLILGLIKAMKGSANNISLTLEATGIHLNIDTAVPLGLFINEVVTNSLKYGFKGNAKGTITTRLTKLEHPNFKLELGDNGCGFSKELNYKKSDSLGLILIHKLATQLVGTVERDHSKAGTNYILEFQEIESLS